MPTKQTKKPTRSIHYTADWMRRGACTGKALKQPARTDMIFFTGKGRPKVDPEHREYCKVCPVQLKCLKYAIAHDLDGVWGNTTRSQREMLPPYYILEVIQEAVLEGWYETYTPIICPVPVYQIEEIPEEYQLLELTAADFLFEFEWLEYQKTILSIVESFEVL